jgi:hypothetical protein
LIAFSVPLIAAYLKRQVNKRGAEAGSHEGTLPERSTPGGTGLGGVDARVMRQDALTSDVGAPPQGSAALDGIYYTISVNPAFPSYASSDEFRFRRDGRFVRGRSSGGTISSGVVGLDGYSAGAALSSTAPSRTGHYRIHGGTLLLRYDDGSDERLAFRGDAGLIWVDGRQYIRTGDLP